MKKIIIALFGSLIFLTIYVTGIHASEFNFSVDIDIPENQIDKEKTYLDLLMKPNQKQEIPYTLYNDTSKDIIVEMVIHSATTNSNGVIEYGDSEGENDESMKYNISDLAKVDKEVTIPANSSVTKTLTLQAPEKSYSGVIAGGITFKEKEMIQDKQSDTLGIVNKFSQVKAILIRTSTEEVQPDLALISAEANQKNIRNVISLKFKNDRAAYMFDLSTTVDIYKDQNENKYLTLKRDSLNIAPNSIFNFNVPLNGQKLEAGHYRVVVKGNTEEKKWTLETEFDISSEKAEELNDKDIDIQSEPKDYSQLIVIAILVLVIFLLVILFILRERRRKK